MTSSNISEQVTSNSSPKAKKETLQSFLRNEELRITFTKKDGTERVMHCTLQESFMLPYEKKTDRVKKVNDDVLPVWDIEANAWRSININTITKAEIA